MPSLQHRVVKLDDARWHGGVRTQAVRLIVMHCTAGASAHSSIRYLNRLGAPPGSRASYHYVIDRDGYIYRMLPVERIAWHAGDSAFPAEPTLLRQNKTVNPYSVGIAWANRNDGEKLTAPQLESATWLCHVFMDRYGFGPSRVVGHYEVSPGRKTDPKPAIAMPEFRALLADNVPPIL